MKIYTRTGDKGNSGLFGGERVRKSSRRLHAYGTVDELNSILGLILCEKLPTELSEQLKKIQSMLFIVGADLATNNLKVKVPRIAASDVAMLEQWIDAMQETLPELSNFIVPGGSRAGSLLHQARTVCRRSERWIVELMDQEKCNVHILTFMNRLSDYLFVAARFVNHEGDQTETPVILR